MISLPRINMDTPPSTACHLLRAGTPSATFAIDYKRREPLLYAIAYTGPLSKFFGALYIGRANSSDLAYTDWHARLRRLDPKANLNWAFRALWGARSDFTFVVLERYESRTSDAAIEQALKKRRDNNARRGPQFDLNMPPSRGQRLYWERQVPDDERALRFYSRRSYEKSQHVQSRKRRKLVPGKFQTPEALLIYDLKEDALRKERERAQAAIRQANGEHSPALAVDPDTGPADL